MPSSNTENTRTQRHGLHLCRTRLIPRFFAPQVRSCKASSQNRPCMVFAFLVLRFTFCDHYCYKHGGCTVLWCFPIPGKNIKINKSRTISMMVSSKAKQILFIKSFLFFCCWRTIHLCPWRYYVWIHTRLRTFPAALNLASKTFIFLMSKIHVKNLVQYW